MCLTALSAALLGVACSRSRDTTAASSRGPIDEGEEAVVVSSGGGAGTSGVDERMESSNPPASASDAAAASDASCVGSECAGCPAPILEVSGGDPQWARNPETGACCRYADAVAVPPSWPYFGTEAECQNDCRCSELDNYVEGSDPQYVTERTSLDCRCAAGDCPTSVEEVEQRLCAPGRAVERREGCGLIIVVDNNGLFGEGWIFEQPSESSDSARPEPRLVGAITFSDVNTAPCRTHEWIAGRSFDYACDEIVACQLCGESLGPEMHSPCASSSP